MGEVLDFSGAATPEEQAQQWIVRIDRARLTAGERAELQAWLARDPRHGELLDLYAKLWHAAGKTGTQTTAAGNGEPRSRSGYHRKRIAVGLAASVAALTFWFGPFRASDDAPRMLQTAVGQHERFGMSDGSQVELNTRSRVQVRYGADLRGIELLEGEGLFDVAKDRSRPFIVKAGATSVRAVGTRFSVRKRSDASVEVVVHEGVVSVSQAGANGGAGRLPSATLRAGQTLAAEPAGFKLAALDPQQLARRLAWQDGRVDFDDASLAAVLQEMNRYADVPFRLGDDKLASIRISGSFATADIDGFVRMLEQGFGLQVERGRSAYAVKAAHGS